MRSVSLGSGRKVRRKELQERVKLCEARGGRSAPGLGSLETAKEILAKVFGARLGEGRGVEGLGHRQ
jgi:hypothetical protein